VAGEPGSGQEPKSERLVSPAGGRTMSSPVGWALLGLLIRREDYTYSLAQRLERFYGRTLQVSSEAQVRTALDALARRQLIEETGTEPGARGQPRVRYRASAKALAAYSEWLAEQGRRDSPLFAPALVMLEGQPALALEILEAYERDCLRRVCRPQGAAAASGSAGISQRIVAEDERLAMEGRLAWIEFARGELERLLAGQT
jgi:DNA-binding PadR family transcriptional regulator